MSTTPEPDFQQTPQEGVSLRQLSDAFARAMGDRRPGVDKEPSPQEGDYEAGADTTLEGGDSRSPTDAPASADAPPDIVDDQDDSDPCEITPVSILEAMLFVGNSLGEPLTSQRAAELMRGVAAEEIPDLVDQLNRRYAAGGYPYHVASEGAGYRLTLRREFWAIRNRFYGRIREARLSQAAIDVLAIVAYRQPIAAEQVNQHRGRPSSQLLTQLVHRRLLRIERSPGKPRVARYATTDRFLEVFGLESLNDLPRSDDDMDTK